MFHRSNALILVASVALGAAAATGGAGCGDGSDSPSGSATSSTRIATTSSSSTTTSATASTSGSPSSPTGSTVRTSTTARAGSATTVPSAGVQQPVIVDLNVDHRPESELNPAALAQQRARIDAAIDEVMRAVGAHGKLTRRLTATAQMSLTVDADGRRILSGHPLVAAVHDDEPTAAASG